MESIVYSTLGMNTQPQEWTITLTLNVLYVANSTVPD
jgi:hypothetical protein